jgi:hypothetical protein
LVEPLFHHGLAIASGYSDNGDVELRTMTGSQHLKGMKRVINNKEIAIICHHVLWQSRHYKITYTSFIQFLHILVAIVALAL